MIFAYQILSMTDYCNLRCAYCDWEKSYGFPLSMQQTEQARENLRWSREFADTWFPDFLMAVYSGGEPFVFPELVELFLDTYRDKWVRISTNGLFEPSRCLPMLRRHGKVILTFSLDGMDLEGNRARFTSEKQLQQVLCNIRIALEQGILVMVLCTLNRFNIDGFYEFAEELYHRFRPYVEQGRLVMPAHYITGYVKTIGLPTVRQEENFLAQMDRQLEANPLLRKVHWHYEALASYIRNGTNEGCQVHRWSRCAHFLEDTMVNGRTMHSYLCAMRGYGELGVFSTEVAAKELGFGEHHSRAHKEAYEKGLPCRCFVDWTAYDLVLQGKVRLEEAADWFAFFREPEVKDWILRYQKEREECTR